MQDILNTLYVFRCDVELILLLLTPPTPPEEFTRAVYVATGIKLTHHLVNTVFKIFDEDRDNKLSHKEFIGVMKERLHRGDGVSAGQAPVGALEEPHEHFSLWTVSEEQWKCVCVFSKYSAWGHNSVIGPWSSNLPRHK